MYCPQILQLTNAIFHLGINEEHVNHSVIVSNYKVSHHPRIQQSIKKIQKYLKKYSQYRHTLIHKHSYQTEELRRVQRLYLVPSNLLNGEKGKRLKNIRANYLKNYLVKQKKEFSKTNIYLADLLDKLFSLLLKEYENQKIKLE